MKYQGCFLAFTNQRNKEVMQKYREAIRNTPFIDIETVSNIVANAPYSRFWVSEERAIAVINELDNGKPVLDTMLPLKREMFEEIYKRVCRLRKKRKKCDLMDIVMEVIHSEAPKLYLQPRCAMDIIYKMRNGFYDKRKPRYKFD